MAQRECWRGCARGRWGGRLPWAAAAATTTARRRRRRNRLARSTPLPSAGPASGNPGPATGRPAGPAPPALEAGRKPVYEWLAELERLRDAAAEGKGHKLSLLDIADHANEPSLTPAACRPTSPRSGAPLQGRR